MFRQNIMFQKPQHALLHQLGFTSLDMHNHSLYSDSTTKIPIIAKRMRKLQMGIALTDHNEVAGNLHLAKDNPDLLVIPGLEITTKERAHILAYFYTHNDMNDFFEKHIKLSRGKNPNLATSVTVQQLCDLAINYNAVIAPAHPFAIPNMFSFVKAIKKHSASQQIIDSLDAVEVICGGNFRQMNMNAVHWAQKLDKAVVGGSDSHSINTLGSVVTLAHGTTVPEILDALKKKQTAVMGTEAKMYQRTLPYTIIASRHLRYVPPLMKSTYDSSLVSTKRFLSHNLGKDKRAEQRVGLSKGIQHLAEELHKGYPHIQKPKMMQKMSRLFKKK